MLEHYLTIPVFEWRPSGVIVLSGNGDFWLRTRSFAFGPSAGCT